LRAREGMKSPLFSYYDGRRGGKKKQAKQGEALLVIEDLYS